MRRKLKWIPVVQLETLAATMFSAELLLPAREGVTMISAVGRGGGGVFHLVERRESSWRVWNPDLHLSEVWLDDDVTVFDPLDCAALFEHLAMGRIERSPGLPVQLLRERVSEALAKAKRIRRLRAWCQSNPDHPLRHYFR